MAKRPETKLERLLWRAAYRVLFRRVLSHWRWPERGGPRADWEPITFEGWTGGELVGLWGAARGPARGTIVLAPPTSKKAKGYFLDFGHGRFLRHEGYNVLMFDFNGFGESPLRSFQYPHDVLAAGREARRRAPEQPVGLFGVCFGAVYGLCAVTYPDHGFTAAVFESPYASVDEILRSMGRRSDRSFFYWIRRLMMRALVPLRPELRAVSQAPLVRDLEAALFISGADDDYVPSATVACFAEALRTSAAPAAERCTHWDVPDAEHLRTTLPDPATYARRIVGFFDAAFAGSAAGNVTPAELPPISVAA